jgi:hypothetical protein
MRDAHATMARATAIGAALLTLTGARAGAQTSPPTPPPSTIDACYVPASGTIYRINTTQSPAAGAPARCLSSTHVPFTWNQQGVQGPAGPQGSQGPRGFTGPAGASGQPGISGYEVVSRTFGATAIAGRWYWQEDVSCPQGKHVIGGGGSTGGDNVVLFRSEPATLTPTPSRPTRWSVGFRNVGSSSVTVYPQLYAVCAIIP